MGAGKQFSNADGRPRVHFWGSLNSCSYSIGPTGTRFQHEDLASAFVSALNHIGHVPCVMIWEGFDYIEKR